MIRQPASLKARALQWLAQREQSPQELRRKLIRLALAESPRPRPRTNRRGNADELGTPSPTDVAPVDPEQAASEVDELLAWLQANGYLSAERFIESRIHARQGRFGSQRIRQELAVHGLALSPEDQHSLASSDYERAREVWQRKFGVLATDPRQRLRQMRFLTSRGFTPEVIRRVVDAKPD